MSETLRTQRAYRAQLKTRLECGCLMTEKDCGLHGPRDAADIMLVSCIFMSEHIRHYGKPPEHVAYVPRPAPSPGAWELLAKELAEVWWWCSNNNANLQHGELGCDTTYSICLMGGVPGLCTFHADTPVKAMEKAKARLKQLPQCGKCQKAMYLTPDEDQWFCHTCDHTLYANTVKGQPSPHEERAQLLGASPAAPRAEWKPKVGDCVKDRAGKRLDAIVDEDRHPYYVVKYNNGQFDEVHLDSLQPAPWKLPEPPLGMAWHRTDWTQEMLPEGYRPLLNGEFIEVGDDHIESLTTWKTITKLTCHFSATPIHVHYRTRRPLPSPVESSPPGNERIKVPADWTECRMRDAWAEEVVEHYNLSTKDDSDYYATIAKFLKATKAERDHFIQKWEKVDRELYRATSLADELKVKLAAAEQRADDLAGQKFSERNHGALRSRASSAEARVQELESELVQARALVPVWVSTQTRLPTEKDGREQFIGGVKMSVVTWADDKFQAIDLWHKKPHWATHWSTPQALPPLPVETEEGEQREFEKWWNTRADKDLDNTMGSTKQAAMAIWNAALNSKKDPS